MNRYTMLMDFTASLVNRLSLVVLYCSMSLLLATNTQAQISVDRIIMTYKASDRPIQNVAVFNAGEKPLGVEVIPEIVENPGLPNEKRTATKDLIVSPKRFSIQAGGQRTLRLLLKSMPKDKEKVFRVRLQPNYTITEEEGETTSTPNAPETKIQIITTVGILIFAEPKEIVSNLTWKRGIDSVEFQNDGNSNVFIDEVKECNAEETRCQEISGTRLYPGASFKIPVSKNHVVSFRKQISERFETIRVD